MAVAAQLLNQRFGSVSVIGREPTDRWGRAMWLCECDCGNVFITGTGNLRKLQSCGCIRKSIATHGLSESLTYSVWANMKQRCFNPKNQYYHRYGGRGITV